MKVIVQRDSATKTPIDCGEGPEAEVKLQALIAQHGPQNVTNEDGTPIVLKEAKKVPESFDDMTVDELKKHLDERNVEYASDDSYGDLVNAAKAQARKEARAASRAAFREGDV